MKLYILLITAIALAAAFFIALPDEKSGYLKKSLVVSGNSSNKVELFFGTFLSGGKVIVWSDKKSGTLFSDPQKNTEAGTSSRPADLRYTGKTEKGLYEAEIKPSLSAEVLADTRQEVLKEYEKQYFEQCSTCHAAAELSRYSKQRWESILNSMKQHSGLSQDDMTAIRRYILLNITN